MGDIIKWHYQIVNNEEKDIDSFRLEECYIFSGLNTCTDGLTITASSEDELIETIEKMLEDAKLYGVKVFRNGRFNNND